MSSSHTDPLPYWEEQIEVIHAIREQGMQAYASQIADLSSSFELKDRTVRCIDEGTPGGIHLAGQGILMTSAQIADFCAKALPDGVVSHEECGACGLYAKRQQLDPTDTDGYGKIWVTKFAEICAVPVKGHVAVTEMARPSGMHIARVAYYDGTGSFDPTRCSPFPPGFVISRFYLDPAYAKEEAGIAASIAMGDHGFGGLITSEEPFLFIAVAHKNQGVPLETLLTELREVVSGVGGKAIVDGFVA